MDAQDHSKPTSPSGHTCRRCGWPFPKAHPSSKRRRAHKRVCGTIEGFTKIIIDSEAVSDDEHRSDSDDQHHSDSDSDSDSDDQEEKEKNPSPKIEKKIIKESGSSAGGVEEKSNRSEDDRFSDAVTELSDAGFSPGVVSDVKKVDEHSEVFEFPSTHSKDADKTEEQDLTRLQTNFPDSDTKHTVPLVEDSDGSHKDKVIDQVEMSAVSGNKDQGEDVHVLSVPSDIPILDKPETLIEDFKDHKSMHSNLSRDDKQAENRSMVDIFEVKTGQENVHESQTSEQESAVVPAVVIEEDKAAETQPLETSKTDPESAANLSEAEVSHDKHPVMTLGELMEAEIKRAEMEHSAPVLTEVGPQETVKEPKSSVSDSKDSVKVGTSKSLVNEGSRKLLSGQVGGVDASVSSSSRNSLEGNWGSVSEISDVFGRSEVSDDRNRLGRSDTFEGSSLVESEHENVEQEASEVNGVKVQKIQPAKSEEAIAKVTNWSTSGHIATTPLRNLMRKAKSPKPKPSTSTSQKDEDAEKAGDPGNSSLTREAPKVNQESSSVKDSGEGEKVKKKRKGWARFMCWSMPD